MHFPKILQTKITPPSKSARTLARTRVTRALLEALQYRLTLFQAGAGYGKSTALTVLAEKYEPLIWYQLTEGDNDPLVFLLHICHATKRVLPQLRELPIPYLETWEGTRGPLPGRGVIDMYINALSTGLSEPTLLVLDDLQLAVNPEIIHLLDRLIGLAPANLHLVLASRPPIKLPNLSRWQAQGDVLSIDQTVLAFNAEEISDLFTNHYGYELTSDEIAALSANTEGWAIALQLIWQSLRGGSIASIETALIHPTESLENLFEILANEVFEGQPQDVKDFMRLTATLREMTPDACDALIKETKSLDEGSTAQSGLPSTAMLAYLQRQELFVFNQGGTMAGPNINAIEPGVQEIRLRYHNIFHRFLRQQAPFEQRRAWHSVAANFYLNAKHLDEAVYHLFHAEDTDGAATLLDTYGNELVKTGRLDTLAHYLDAIPPKELQNHPQLLYFLGDLARLHSRFEEASGWYQQAEVIWRDRNQSEGISKAIRGQARVYLDTVDPSRAEKLLQKALRLSDGTEDRETQARLYELLSENKLNAGHAEEAERYRRQAQALRNEGPSDSQLLYRVLLRTGRLDEARGKLEERAKLERQQPVQTPRAHRETLHLLSLIYAFQGLGQQAYLSALEGTRRGVELDSPFVTAVGFMRQGHALMLPLHDHHIHLTGQEHSAEQFVDARKQFTKAIELSRTLSVSRLRVEAYWGLCRSYGYQGDLSQATQFASESIELALQAGDEWIASLVRLALGASLILAARYEAAEEWLNQAVKGFEECSDPFGYSAARLWQCIGWFHQGDHLRLEQFLPELVSTCQIRGYNFLFTRPTLIGLPDERMVIPLLICAREHGWEPDLVTGLLNEIGLHDILIHPGFQLRVYTLGTFQTWRGNQPIPQNGWRREKARQLFQILITFRDAPLDRDQIIELLWPDVDLAAAHRNFKVALNTLYNVLEPDREAGSESAYVVREGTTYGLRPGSDVWIDAQSFMELIQEGDKGLGSNPDAATISYQQALELFQGDYLPDARYETWAAAEREHLTVHFLRTADRLSGLLLQQNRFGDVVDLCQRILSTDNCWERAYRHLMLAFHRLGDQGQVARTYQRCIRCLDEELNVKPAEDTEKLFHDLIEKAVS